MILATAIGRRFAPQSAVLSLVVVRMDLGFVTNRDVGMGWFYPLQPWLPLGAFDFNRHFQSLTPDFSIGERFGGHERGQVNAG